MSGIRHFIVGSLCLALATPASAWIHDRDANKIDDRIEQVQTVGVASAHEKNDVSRRRTIALFEDELRVDGSFEYGIYIGFDRRPTEADEDTLSELGFQSIKTYQFIDYIRARGSFAQIQQAAQLGSVTRVEAIPMVYATNHYGSRIVRARDSRGLNAAQAYSLFPSAHAELGLDGTGIVIAVLDSGVNDEMDSVNPTYVGHESLAGKFLGGGEFFLGDPLLNTPADSSINPQDKGSYHGTHVAGSALGTGGPSGYLAGVAPKARLVDCKVLSDAGLGFGSADGVEWCILNKDRMWAGLSGADTIYAGVDVLSLSLGGLDESDGSDAGAQMINAAIREGLVACIATGNDDSTSYISSPAAADSCISVGATEHLVSLQHSDDLVSSFSNEGPRNEDLDLDHMDEMKPSVVAPGVNILSANGDPVTTTGQSYVTKSGTSMSTPHVSGVVALLLQANPNLTPMQVRDILQNTATHNILSSKGDRPNDPYGLDPNYDPGCGWGEVDAYAAALEAMNSTSGVQVVQIGATARPLDGAIDFVWQTQREFAFSGFNVYRAEDVAGAPGAFVQQNGSLIAGVGSSVIEGVPNRTVYTYEDTDAALQLGTRYWYQVEWVDNGSTAHPEPPVPVTYGELPAVAVVNFSYYHNTPDNDLVTALGVSFGHDESNPEFQTIGFSEATADSSVVVEPANAATAINGYIEWFHSYTLTAADGVGGNLPPSHTWPWFLKLDEGGFVNRQGRVTSFEMFVPDVPGGTTGTTYVTDSVLPEVTVETQTSVVWIPEIAVSSPEVGVSRSASTLQLTGANPFSNHLGIRFSLAADEAADGGELAVYDLNGRLVRRIWEGRGRSGDFVASWNGRDTQGSVAAPGVYFVRLRAGSFTSTAKATLIR